MQALRKIVMTFLATSAAPVFADSPPDALFQNDEVLNLVLTAPVAALINERPEEEYLEATITYQAADGAWKNLDVGVRTRGNFRHNNCDFPPLTLNFNKSEVEGTPFDNQNKLKMVVHCKDSGWYAQSVLREYLAYRLLNALTDQSFRVRLLQITYVDSEERRSNLVRYAFFIEHKKRLAKRMGRETLDVKEVEIGAIQPDHLNLTTLFQFLIGNTDFSPIEGGYDECCHNYDLFAREDAQLLSIPYDFDNSGFVSAPYAQPAEWVDVHNVRERAYLGYCVNNELVQGSIARIRAAREELYALVAKQPGLEASVIDRIAEYMDEFFEIIDDPEEVQRQILDKCV